MPGFFFVGGDGASSIGGCDGEVYGPDDGVCPLAAADDDDGDDSGDESGGEETEALGRNPAVRFPPSSRA